MLGQAKGDAGRRNEIEKKKTVEKLAMYVRDIQPEVNSKDFKYAETKSEKVVVELNFSHLIEIITSDFL